MKKLESTLVNMVGVLVCTCLIMGGILAFVNHATEGPISLQAEKALSDGIKAVMMSDQLNVTANDTVKETIDNKECVFIVHKVADASGKELGAAIESTTLGFGGDLKVLVGFNPQGEILGYTLLEHAETPGLGAKADKWFQKDGKASIIGKNPATPLKVSKDGGDVDAITASTITSRAFLKAVNQAYNVYMKKDTDAESGATKKVATIKAVQP
ncbi:MAG: RnfABCDGE type electron transport complex subunit G [Prevotella sp.]|nr:RnfABCDGE type electron transport complex subunit G [Prevotella sp.]